MNNLVYKVYAKHLRDDQFFLVAAFADEGDMKIFLDGYSDTDRDWEYMTEKPG